MSHQQEQINQPSGQNPLSSDTGTNSKNPASTVVETLEHRRFAEFCDACQKYRYIGLCYGAPGVGKTLSARYHANWDNVQAFWQQQCRSKPLLKQTANGTVAFYTAPVIGSAGRVEIEIKNSRSLLHSLVVERARRYATARTERLYQRSEQLRDPRRNPSGYRSDTARRAEQAFQEQRERWFRVQDLVPDPTTLLVIDEADRLKMAALEQIRSLFDQGGIGLVLIGMPGLEKRLARFPQFYSRIGFVHEFRSLHAVAIQQLFDQGWTPCGVALPPQPWAPEAVAAIIRMTGGDFRLLNRLLTQVERVLEINGLQEVGKAVVEAARESLVIGES